MYQDDKMKIAAYERTKCVGPCNEKILHNLTHNPELRKLSTVQTQLQKITGYN